MLCCLLKVRCQRMRIFTTGLLGSRLNWTSLPRVWKRSCRRLIVDSVRTSVCSRMVTLIRPRSRSRGSRSRRGRGDASSRPRASTIILCGSHRTRRMQRRGILTISIGINESRPATRALKTFSPPYGRSTIMFVILSWSNFVLSSLLPMVVCCVSCLASLIHSFFK